MDSSKYNHKIQAIIFRKGKRDYEFLLLRRIPLRGGFWQPVTGRCEKGEPYLEAAKREVKEETGIDHFKRILEEVYSFKLENRKDKEIAYGFEVDSKTKVNLKVNIYPEHDKQKWCNSEEALNLLKWPQNKEALKRLNLIIRNP